MTNNQNLEDNCDVDVLPYLFEIAKYDGEDLEAAIQHLATLEKKDAETCIIRNRTLQYRIFYAFFSYHNRYRRYPYYPSLNKDPLSRFLLNCASDKKVRTNVSLKQMWERFNLDKELLSDAKFALIAGLFHGALFTAALLMSYLGSAASSSQLVIFTLAILWPLMLIPATLMFTNTVINSAWSAIFNDEDAISERDILEENFTACHHLFFAQNAFRNDPATQPFPNERAGKHVLEEINKPLLNIAL